MKLAVPPQFVFGAGIVAAAALGLYVAVKSGAAATVTRAGLDAINPGNRDNVFASAVNGIGAAQTGDPAWNLGAWIWEKTHPEMVNAEARAVYGDPAPVVADPPSKWWLASPAGALVYWWKSLP